MTGKKKKVLFLGMPGKTRDSLVVFLVFINGLLFIIAKMSHFAAFGSITERRELRLAYQKTSYRTIYPVKRKDFVHAWFNDNTGDKWSNYTEIRNMFEAITAKNWTNKVDLTSTEHDNRCFIEDPDFQGQTGCFVDIDSLLELQQEPPRNLDYKNEWDKAIAYFLKLADTVDTKGVVLSSRIYEVSVDKNEKTFEKVERMSSFMVCTQSNWEANELKKGEVAIVPGLTPFEYRGLKCYGAIDRGAQRLYWDIPYDCEGVVQLPNKCLLHKTNPALMSSLAAHERMKQGTVDPNLLNVPASSMYSHAVFNKDKQEIYEVSRTYLKICYLKICSRYLIDFLFKTGYKSKFRAENAWSGCWYCRYQLRENGKYLMDIYYATPLNINNLPGTGIVLVILQCLIFFCIMKMTIRAQDLESDLLVVIFRQSTTNVLLLQFMWFYFLNFDFYEGLRAQQLTRLEDKLEMFTIFAYIGLFSAEIIHKLSTKNGFNAIFRLVSYVSVATGFIVYWNFPEAIMNIKYVKKDVEMKEAGCDDTSLCSTGRSFFQVVFFPLIALAIVMIATGAVLVTFPPTASRPLNQFEEKCIGGPTTHRLRGFKKEIVYDESTGATTVEGVILCGYVYLNGEYLIRTKDLLFYILYSLWLKVYGNSMSVTRWRIGRNTAGDVEGGNHIFFGNLEKGFFGLKKLGAKARDLGGCADAGKDQV